MDKTLSATVGLADEGSRFDVFLAGCPGIHSRASAQHLIEAGLARIGDRRLPKNHRLKMGDTVVYEPPDSKAPTVGPESIPLRIVFEDNDVLVVDKEAGMVVHPAAGNYSGTLVNAALAHTTLANIGAPLRPGVIHRLDKDTSGLIVMAKTDSAYYSLAEQIKERRVGRVYLALVKGGFADETGRIEAPIRRNPKDRKTMAVGPVGGRVAITNFKVLSVAAGYSLLEVALDTGRTHQIRVHFKFIKHPIVGDPVYAPAGSGRPLGLKRQFLHAFRLAFDHPVSAQRLEFTAELPADLKDALAKIEGLQL